jgi:hypothetical protein
MVSKCIMEAPIPAPAPAPAANPDFSQTSNQW